mgnify:CR=1 FL=1
MEKKEIAMVGLEIVAYAGDARTKLLNALKEAENGNFNVAEQMIEEANEFILKAHQTQTKMLQAEAKGEDMEIGFIMVHGQDHLMTTMLLRDLMKHFIQLYKRTR